MAKTLLMGILNATPDSFFDQGSYFDPAKAIERGREIYRLGADILDIGGASSRPYSENVSEEEELNRVLSVIETLAKELPICISIDTYNPRVAAKAIEKGAKMLNDITGFSHPEMRQVAASSNCDLCLVHMQGTPKTMQINPSYPDGVVNEVLRFFEQQLELLKQAGVDESRVILDPGISFGKRLEDNLAILSSLDQFKKLGFRVMIGASRKLSKLLNKPASDRLASTLAVHAKAILDGVDAIRAHDIAEHRDLIDTLKCISP